MTSGYIYQQELGLNQKIRQCQNNHCNRSDNCADMQTEADHPE
jgi:hypothetical protein